MLKAARISFAKEKKNIFIYGIINGVAFIIFFLALKYLNLLHLSGIRFADYVFFFLFSMLQVKGWVKSSGGYMPSLEAFCIIFFTGVWSFVVMGAFMYLYSLFDSQAIELYFSTYGKLNSFTAVFIAMEGGAGSIIVALAMMMYSDRYQDGEVEP